MKKSRCALWAGVSYGPGNTVVTNYKPTILITTVIW